MQKKKKITEAAVRKRLAEILKKERFYEDEPLFRQIVNYHILTNA